jgi:hypothetical protein
MFTILLETPNGWTDFLGPDLVNQFSTTHEAQNAIESLKELWPSAKLKLVHNDDLGKYSLIF